MKKNNISLQYLFIYAVILFWGIPFIQDLLPAKDAAEIVWTCLWFVNSAFCLIMGYLLYQQERQWNWYLIGGFMLIFLPLPILFYEWKDLILIPIYGFCTLLGQIIGYLSSRDLRKKQ